MVEGGGAHLGSSLPVSVHVRGQSSSFVRVRRRSYAFVVARARSSSLVRVRFRSRVVAFVGGGWLRSCAFAFVRGRSRSFLGGLERSRSFLSVRVVFVGGRDVGEVWWWWAVGGWRWWLLLVAVHGVVVWLVVVNEDDERRRMSSFVSGCHVAPGGCQKGGWEGLAACLPGLGTTSLPSSSPAIDRVCVLVTWRSTVVLVVVVGGR